MRKIWNFIIAVILGTAAATGMVYLMDSMFVIPYGKEWLAYVMMSVAMGIGIGFSTMLNTKMNHRKRG